MDDGELYFGLVAVVREFFRRSTNIFLIDRR